MAGSGRIKARVVHRVTSAPRSAAEDQDMRMRRYLITMAVRTTCFILAVVFEGWLRWVLVAAATFLPYVAVVLANAVGPRHGDSLETLDHTTRALPPGTSTPVVGARPGATVRG